MITKPILTKEKKRLFSLKFNSMGNIQYSVTDICYTFYRSSSPFDSTPANYTENEKDMSFIAFIKQEITSHEMKES